MTDSYALLADATTSGRRTSTLKADDRNYTVRGSVMHSDGEQLLLIRAWMHDKYVYVLLDDRASVLATATGEDYDSTYQHIRDELERKHIPLSSGDNEWLLADHVDGGRRTSVLKADDGAWSLRVKLLDTGDDVYIQLRIEVYDIGYVHLVLHHDGAIVALVTGATDADAWGRLQGELRRRDIELD